MMDSSVESLGKVEYDVQIWLQYQEIKILPKNSKWGSPHIVTSHKSVRNQKFLIETIPEMTDSTSPRFFMLEFVV